MDMQNQLKGLFKNDKIKFLMYMDNAQKIIYVKTTERTQNIPDNTEIRVVPEEEYIVLEILALTPLKVAYTYDSDYGAVFLEWFKPILRSIVNDKYELKGDIISDELIGTDYCQVRDDGILLFANLSNMLEFTI